MRLAGTRLRHHPSRSGLTKFAKGGPVWTGDVRWNEQWAAQPLGWTRPRRIFVVAHGDLFHEGVPVEWIDRVWAVMAASREHTFQVLTKRAHIMRAYVSTPTRARVREAMRTLQGEDVPDPDFLMRPGGWPLPNVWLGVSVEDQMRAEERIPLLRATPAALRYLSVEPMLGPVCPWTASIDARTALLTGAHWAPEIDIDWVICGGESGRRARDMDPGWARELQAACLARAVPFHLKQMARRAPIPTDLAVQEFPP